jgi:hypothetical protein
MNKRNNQAQSLIAYVVLISVTAAVIVSLRAYMVRIVQAKFRQSADVFGQGEQYARGVTLVSNLDADAAGGIEPVNTAAISIDGQNFIIERVDSLQEQISYLTLTTDFLEAGIFELDTQINTLSAQGMAEQAGGLIKDKDRLIDRLDFIRKLALEKQAEIDAFKEKHPDYFKS